MIQGTLFWRGMANDRSLYYPWHGAVLSLCCADGVMREQRHAGLDTSQSYLCDCDSPITYRTLGGMC